MNEQLPQNVIADNKRSGRGIELEVTCLECGYIGAMAKVGTAKVPKGFASNLAKIVSALLSLAIAAAVFKAFWFAALFTLWFHVPLGIGLFLLYRCLPGQVAVVQCPMCRSELQCVDA